MQPVEIQGSRISCALWVGGMACLLSPVSHKDTSLEARQLEDSKWVNTAVLKHEQPVENMLLVCVRGSKYQPSTFSLVGRTEPVREWDLAANLKPLHFMVH